MRSVWSRVASGSMTVVRAGRVEAGQQHGGLDLRRGHRQAIDDRQRIGGAAQRERQRPPSRLRAPARPSPKRIEDAAHRPLAQRGVAVEGRGDAVAADDAHHQPRRRCRHCRNRARRPAASSPPTPTPWTRHAPSPARSTARAERAAWPRAVRSTSSPSSRPRSRSRRRRARRRSGRGARSICRPARGRAP